MKKLYIWGWHSPSQVYAIENSGHEVVKWFVNIKNNKDENKESMTNIVYDISKIKNINKSLEIVPENILKNITTEFLKFSDMYSRVNYSRGLTVHETLNIFNIYIRYFYSDLKKSNPDYVLFSSFPHFGSDYVLYLCAKALNIKINITFQTLFANKFFAIESLKDFQNVHKQQEHSLNNIILEKSFKKELFYMNKIKVRKRLCFLRLLRNIVNLFLNKKQPLSFTGSIQVFQECKNSFLDKNFITSIDIDCKYVYFPLQLQPEMTTSMLGGTYADQLLALEQLSQVLPDDWKIYVKENPKQTTAQRGKLFFQRLNTIPKVEYLSPSINTHYLIENSQFVSVVTGTAGWEAISGGKNVLIFGLAWYNSLPGVFKYTESFALEDLLSYKINHSILEEKINSLLNRAYNGVIDPNYNKMLKNYSEENNQQYLLNYLKGTLI